MTDVRVRELFESTLDSAPPARFDLDSAMRAGRRRHRVRTAAVLGSSALAILVAVSLVVTVVPRVGPAPTVPVAGSPAAVVQLPSGVAGAGSLAYAVRVEPSGGPGLSSPTAPVLEVWIDPQCPPCASLHRSAGATIAQLADEGAATVYYRPATFLDANLTDENTAAGAPESSRRAVAAWGCAVDQGRGREYLDALLTGQPTEEGAGFTDERLRELARTAGLAGGALDGFRTCQAAGRYLAWADAAEREFEAARIPGTPMFRLDGREIPNATAADPAALRAAVLEAAAGDA